MQRFNNFNYTQKHYKGPDDGIKPKPADVRVSRDNAININFESSLINIHVFLHVVQYFPHIISPFLL